MFSQRIVLLSISLLFLFYFSQPRVAWVKLYIDNKKSRKNVSKHCFFEIEIFFESESTGHITHFEASTSIERSTRENAWLVSFPYFCKWTSHFCDWETQCDINVHRWYGMGRLRIQRSEANGQFESRRVGEKRHDILRFSCWCVGVYPIKSIAFDGTIRYSYGSDIKFLSVFWTR